MRIQHNLMAVNTHREYNKTIGNVSKAAEKLSSGYRINRAGDDAAGLAISEKMRAQIRGLDMASKNSQDAVSMVQTAEGALQETHNILQRMRELAVQSASDTNESSIDRAALQQEFAQMRSEVNDIASKTRFNDQNLIDGTFQKFTRSLNAAVTTSAFTGKLNSISVAPANAGNYTMKIQCVTAKPSQVVTGFACSVSFYRADAHVGGVIGNAAASMYATDNTTGDLAGDAGAISQIDFIGFETDAHNGNVYELKVEGSSLDDMSFSLLDSRGKIVARTNGVNAAEWINSPAAGMGTPNRYSVNFEGVGTLVFTMDDEAAINVSTLKAASNIKMQFGQTGKKQAVIPAVEARLELTINGETVVVRKGETSANFTQTGISFDFDALSDAQFVDAATAFGGQPIDGADTASAASVTISVNETKTAPMLIQTGANMGDTIGINIDAMNAEMLGIAYSDIREQASASRAIDEVNRAINTVSRQRAELGALQNRLEYKINNLDTSSENLTASESRIRDVDMAKEMTNFTKSNIQMQAATSMLAQANQSPQNVLSLIGG